MGNLTLCDKKLIGDIPRYEISDFQDMLTLVSHWLEKKDETKSVFVCFQNWKSSETWSGDDYRNQQTSFLVTHLTEDVEIFTDYQCEEVDLKDLDYAIFEFESYKEAFSYCIDLKEGF